MPRNDSQSLCVFYLSTLTQTMCLTVVFTLFLERLLLLIPIPIKVDSFLHLPLFPSFCNTVTSV